ncbi:MAG: AAA family ATPase, partial [Gammaproteobacteria bacterium]
RTQSALLQAMQERKVAMGGTTHALPAPFHVLATQNPIEQEGTYPLPEAQLDRFLLEVEVTYPDEAAERAMLLATTGAAEARAQPAMTAAELIAATSGLGFMVQSASQFLVTDVVVLGILLIALIAFALEMGLRALQRKLVPWHGQSH